MSTPHDGARGRAGFTLAEVMVTLLIVSIGLLLVTQGLTRARFTSAETHYRKVARELALLTLGQLESGLFWEELEGGGEVLTGTYAEEGHEEMGYELVLGDEEFQRHDDGKNARDPSAYHDSWQYEREREERQKKKDHKDDEDEDAVAKPFEKARIKVTYPKFEDRPNTLVIERWIPWEQVYGSAKDAKGAKDSKGKSKGSEETKP